MALKNIKLEVQDKIEKIKEYFIVFKKEEFKTYGLCKKAHTGIILQ
jgi:hypothetical protein